MTPAELREARKTLGLTQAQLAQALGLKDWRSAQSISAWERGYYPIPGYVEVILDLALSLPEARARLKIENVAMR